MKMLVTSLHYLTQDEQASVISEGMNTITTNKLNLKLCAITRKNFVSILSVLMTLVSNKASKRQMHVMGGHIINTHINKKNTHMFPPIIKVEQLKCQ
jgi:hypothetical protein